MSDKTETQPDPKRTLTEQELISEQLSDWRMLIDYDTVEAWGEIQIRDATGRRATIWFQPTDAHDVPRQRWHLDLRIPPEIVEDRVAAAIEAGGELVDTQTRAYLWSEPAGLEQ